MIAQVRDSGILPQIGDDIMLPQREVYVSLLVATLRKLLPRPQHLAQALLFIAEEGSRVLSSLELLLGVVDLLHSTHLETLALF